MSLPCPKCGIPDGRHRPGCPWAAYTLPGADDSLEPMGAAPRWLVLGFPSLVIATVAALVIWAAT